MIMLGTKSRCPGASSSVTLQWLVSKRVVATSTVTPAAQRLSILPGLLKRPTFYRPGKQLPQPSQICRSFGRHRICGACIFGTLQGTALLSRLHKMLMSTGPVFTADCSTVLVMLEGPCSMQHVLSVPHVKKSLKDATAIWVPPLARSPRARSSGRSSSSQAQEKEALPAWADSFSCLCTVFLSTHLQAEPDSPSTWWTTRRQDSLQV